MLHYFKVFSIKCLIHANMGMFSFYQLLHVNNATLIFQCFMS